MTRARVPLSGWNVPVYLPNLRLAGKRKRTIQFEQSNRHQLSVSSGGCKTFWRGSGNWIVCSGEITHPGMSLRALRKCSSGASTSIIRGEEASITRASGRARMRLTSASCAGPLPRNLKINRGILAPSKNNTFSQKPAQLAQQPSSLKRDSQPQALRCLQQELRQGVGARRVARHRENLLLARQQPRAHSRHRRARHRSSVQDRITARKRRDDSEARARERNLRSHVRKSGDEVFGVRRRKRSHLVSCFHGIRRIRALAPKRGDRDRQWVGSGEADRLPSVIPRGHNRQAAGNRSEEHTSELQSLA